MFPECSNPMHKLFTRLRTFCLAALNLAAILASSSLSASACSDLTCHGHVM
jgi:hypothetical protein